MVLDVSRYEAHLSGFLSYVLDFILFFFVFLIPPTINTLEIPMEEICIFLLYVRCS